ncbi:MAG: hypothetical protein JW891_07255 [Candidatus Lokiarchaeota archaeon]|nr:hypothetical protein [Candidatus Lokiarchaeota archaeon]
MKKSAGIAFIISLVVLLLLNFLFYIIGMSLDDTLSSDLNLVSNNFTWLLWRLAQPSTAFPWEIAGDWMEFPGVTDGDKLRYVMMILIMIFAAIAAGLTGGDISNAVIGWVITMIVCIVMVTIAASQSQVVCYWVTSRSSTQFSDAVVWIIVKGIVNMILFGIVAALVALVVGRSKKY